MDNTKNVLQTPERTSNLPSSTFKIILARVVVSITIIVVVVIKIQSYLHPGQLSPLDKSGIKEKSISSNQVEIIFNEEVRIVELKNFAQTNFSNPRPIQDRWLFYREKHGNSILMILDRNSIENEKYTKIHADISRRIQAAKLLDGNCRLVIVKSENAEEKYGLLIDSSANLQSKGVYTRSLLEINFPKPIFFKKPEGYYDMQTHALMRQLKNDIAKVIASGLYFESGNSYSIAIEFKDKSKKKFNFDTFDEKKHQLRLYFPSFDTVYNIKMWEKANEDVNSWIEKNKRSILEEDEKSIRIDQVEDLADDMYDMCLFNIQFELYNFETSLTASSYMSEDKINKKLALAKQNKKEIVGEIVEEVKRLVAEEKGLKDGSFLNS